MAREGAFELREVTCRESQLVEQLFDRPACVATRTSAFQRLQVRTVGPERNAVCLSFGVAHDDELTVIWLSGASAHIAECRRPAAGEC